MAYPPQGQGLPVSPLENLLGNSGFGAWSNSDANKGLATLTYDNLAGGAFELGETITGATSGAVGKVIIDDGASEMTLGAVTGTFQDPEQIGNGTGVTADVNGDATIGVANDPMNNDSTGDWDDDGGNITLADNVGEYTVTTNAGNQRAWIANTTLEAGKLYKIELDIKDGTAAGQDIEGYLNDGAAQYGTIRTTAAGWASVSWVFECATGTATGLVGFRIPTSLAASNIEIRRFSCYEVTPCCTGNNTLAPDGWYKDATLDLYREHRGSNTLDGSFYALKSVPTLQNDFVYWPNASIYTLAEHLARYAGRTVTLGAWVQSSTPADFKIGFYDDGAWYTSAAHSGGSTFEWLEVTRTLTASTTFAIGYVHEAATPGVAHISQFILIFGNSVGPGNYVPRPEEVVDCDATILLSNYTADSVPADIVINLEAESDGLIPKGCRAVHLNLFGQNTATDKFLRLLSESGGVNGPRIEDSVVAAKLHSVSGRQVCAATGDIYIDIEDGNWSNVTIEILAIELR